MWLICVILSHVQIPKTSQISSFVLETYWFEENLTFSNSITEKKNLLITCRFFWSVFRHRFLRVQNQICDRHFSACIFSFWHLAYLLLHLSLTITTSSLLSHILWPDEKDSWGVRWVGPSLSAPTAAFCNRLSLRRGTESSLSPKRRERRYAAFQKCVLLFTMYPNYPAGSKLCWRWTSCTLVAVLWGTPVQSDTWGYEDLRSVWPASQSAHSHGLQSLDVSEMSRKQETRSRDDEIPG